MSGDSEDDWIQRMAAADAAANAVPPRPDPSRAAWLLTALGSFGRSSIPVEQYEELRGLAVAQHETERRAERIIAKLQTHVRALQARIHNLRPEATRASGDGRCRVCGLPYRDHPADPIDAFLTVCCDGHLVKL